MGTIVKTVFLDQNSDGMFISFRNSDGDPQYQLQITDSDQNGTVDKATSTFIYDSIGPDFRWTVDTSQEAGSQEEYDKGKREAWALYAKALKALGNEGKKQISLTDEELSSRRYVGDKVAYKSYSFRDDDGNTVTAEARWSVESRKLENLQITSEAPSGNIVDVIIDDPERLLYTEQKIFRPEENLEL